MTVLRRCGLAALWPGAGRCSHLRSDQLNSAQALCFLSRFTQDIRGASVCRVGSFVRAWCAGQCWCGLMPFSEGLAARVAGTAVTVEGPPLPEGWAAAKDAQGRTYFWHKATKKVQWDRPTAASAPA